jgi:diguanylate cyclase (GGDEF)-like protein
MTSRSKAASLTLSFGFATFFLVCVAALLGIWSRPLGELANVWPANAVALGLLLRVPSQTRLMSAAGIVLGFVAADLMAGGTPLKIALLTAGNLAGISVGYGLYRSLGPKVLVLGDQQSVLALLLVSISAAAASGVAGMVIDPLLFGNAAASGWRFWFITELQNYLVFLPAVLSLPIRLERPEPARARERRPPTDYIPLGVLAASFVVAMNTDGIVSLAIPVPAMMWCATVYTVFETSVLLIVYASIVTAFPPSALLVGTTVGDDARSDAIAIRLLIALLALCPVMISILTAARDDLLSKAAYLADFDFLTGLHNRRSFTERARKALASCEKVQRPAALLMLDIDHFKAVNDSYGHGTGDLVLAQCAKEVTACVRGDDLVGRLGGEEFVVLLLGSDSRAAFQVAERIRFSVSLAAVPSGAGAPIHCTVSIGVTSTAEAGYDIQSLIQEADKALYEAKRTGRNRVRLSAQG